MQNFHQGELPRATISAENEMVHQISSLLRNAVDRQPRFKSSGFEVDFDALAAILDSDAAFTTRVFIDAGFTPYGDGTWVTGKGQNNFSDREWNAVTDVMTEILDTFRPV